MWNHRSSAPPGRCPKRKIIDFLRFFEWRRLFHCKIMSDNCSKFSECGTTPWVGSFRESANFTSRNILSRNNLQVGTFCELEHFANWNVLQVETFCELEHFASCNILHILRVGTFCELEPFGVRTFHKFKPFMSLNLSLV